MSAALNSGRAFLQAGNHAAAKRVAREALERDADDIRAILLLIDVEEDAGDHKAALALAGGALSKAPDSPALRMACALSLIRLKRRREAKTAIDAFERDFPYREMDIGGLRMAFDGKFGNLRGAEKRLDELAEGHEDDPDVMLMKAILINNRGQAWKAQKLFREVLKHDPEGFTVNDHFALNQFQLCRFASARKHARIALRQKPTAFNKRLIWFSYIMLFPPLLFLHAVVALGLIAISCIHWSVVLIFAIIFAEQIFWPRNVVARWLAENGVPLAREITNWSVWPYSAIMLMLWAPFADMIDKRRQDVKLRGY